MPKTIQNAFLNENSARQNEVRHARSSESGCIGGCSGVALGCAAAAPHDPAMTHRSKDMLRASRMIDLLSPWSRRGESSPTYPIDQGLLGDFEAGGTLSYS